MSEVAQAPDLSHLVKRLKSTGDWRGVADECKAILKSRPNSASTMRLLTECLLRGSRFKEVADVLEPFVRQGLTDHVLLFRYAAARSGLGDARGAAHFYRRCTELDGRYFEAWLNLGVAYKSLGRLGDAVHAYRKAIELKPDLPEAHNNLALVLQQQGEQDEALAMLEKAIELRPHYARAHANRGQSLLKLDRIPEAEESCRKAIELDPRLTDGYINLGLVLMAQNRQLETCEVFRKVAAMLPDDSKTITNLGVAEKEAGNMARAAELHRRAAALDLDESTPYWNEAHTSLLCGDFGIGWERYEARWGTGDFKTSIRPWAVPRWRGEPVGNRALLVHVEQGVGDTSQFCRFVPGVAEANPGAQIIMEVQPSMRRLIEHSFRRIPRLSVFEHREISGTNLPPFDVHIPMASLPRATGMRLHNASGAPYLEVPEPRQYRQEDDKLVIGFSWKSLGTTGRKRSLTLEAMAKVLAKPGVRLIDLQYSDTSEERRALQETHGIEVHHDEDVDSTKDLCAFAEQVMGCDLVVSIDNTTVHMAGALGVPCWVILPWVPDWRWMLQREDTPWYDCLKLYRPPAIAAWDPVLERISGDLDALLAGDETKLEPKRWEGPPATVP